MEEPLPRGKSPKTPTLSSFEKIDAESKKGRIHSSIQKRQSNSFFDQWLKGRKKRRLHHPFSTDDNDSGDEFDENIVTFQEPFVLNISNAQGAGLENAAMLGAVQSVNVRTGRIYLISWNHMMVVCDELSELLEPNVLKKEWQIEEEQEESHIQDNDLVVKPGMILPFSVLSVTKQGEHRKIQVSVLPKNVNRHIDPCFLTKGCLVYGMIYEREEYGYRVTFGLESIQYDGFLPLEETESQILKSGSLIWCVITHVKKVDKKTVVKVSTNRQLVCDSKISYQSKWPFGCVFPGLRMEGQVLQKKWKGSWTHIKLASNMTGFVYSMETIRESFLDLRVIFVDVGKRVIYLSSVESLVGFLEPAKLPNAWKLGNILKNVIVEGHLSSPKGILLRHSESNTILFAPNSQLADSDISADAALSSLPSLQSIVCCRIVAFSPLDGTIIVSMKPSILSKTIVSFDELHPGMPVQCKIESVRENGCLCIVEDKIRAWIPQMHFGDTVGARLKNKFVAGKKVKGCVLSIFQDSHRCTITTKKKFIDNQYPVIASIQDAKSNIGSAAYCCVYQVSSSRGLQVEFFQGVKGFLPVSYMGLEKLPSLEWLSENYPVGKTLKVWILSVHEESHRIIVSLSRDVIMNDDSSAIVTYGAIVGIEYGNLIVEVCLLDSRKRALLPKEHLSDFAYLSERIYSLLVSYFESNSSSLPLEQVVILRSRISSNDCRALVSLKRSLIQFALTYPSLSSDRICSEWKANQMLPGFVEKETLHKYLIGFIGNWKVWIDKNEWSLNGKLMLRTPRKHETVWCRLHVESRERKVVCLWTQLNNFTPQEWDKKFSFYPTRYFDDVEQWKSMLLQWRVINEATVTRQSLFKQGEIVSAQLVSKRPHGYVFSLSNNVVKEEQVTGVSLSEVEQVSSQATVRVLEYDSFSGFFLVCPVEDCNANSFSSGTETSLTPITCNSRLRGIVLLIKEEYLIMRIPQLNNCLVYLTSWDPRVRANLSVIYSVDSVIEGTVYYCSERLTMLVAMDANDEKKRMIENVQVGDHVIGRIVRISTVHLHLFIPRYSVYGRIHCSQIMSEPGKDTLISPLEHFEIGQQVEAKIIAKDHSKKYQILDLTLNKNDVVTMEKNLVDWSNLSCRQCLTGFVHKIMTDKVLISFSSKVIGVMKRWGFTQNEQLLSSKQIFSSLRTGQPLHCTIIRLNQSRKLLEVALSELVKPVHVGDSVVAHVGQVLYGAEFCLELPKWVEWSLSTCRGVLSFTDIDDNFDRATAKISHIKSRKWIKGIIIECSSVKEKPIAIVSLRNSDAHPTQSTPKDIRWKNLMDLKAGQLVRGFIRHHSLKGCFVQLSSSIIGRVMLRNLSDGFVQNVEETFPLGQLVTAKVIDIQNGQVELSLRESDLSDRQTIYSVLQKGLRLQGTVKNIQPFGIFVSLGLGVTGLCHLSTLEKQSQYRIGEVIWVQVDNVDREKGRINLHPLDPIKENGRIGTLRQLVGIDSTSQNSSLQHSYIDSVSVDANRDVVESSDESEGNGSDCEVLQVSESFQLQDEILLENDDSQNRANKNNVAKMVVESTEQQQDDERLERYSDEEIELERSLKEPQNEEDFERHVLASPDDSSIWIRYMAYFISMGQIQKAKETARRALEKISVRNQDEKLNIWIAYLNLEAQYGDESHLASILEEACSRTNAEKLLLNFAKSMQKTRKEKSEEIYLRACRQFKHSPEVWMQVGTFYYEKKKNISEGRKILERALLSLPKQDHIQVITKFTVLEYKFGSIERARTIFENMISSFPKRLDIWNVYLDMEWKQVDTEEDKERLRLLFERACSLSLSSKKMKFLFKKYLEFEKTIGGNPERVKTLAREYVEKQL